MMLYGYWFYAGQYLPLAQENSPRVERELITGRLPSQQYVSDSDLSTSLLHSIMSHNVQCSEGLIQQHKSNASSIAIVQ